MALSTSIEISFITIHGIDTYHSLKHTISYCGAVLMKCSQIVHFVLQLQGMFSEHVKSVKPAPCFLMLTSNFLTYIPSYHTPNSFHLHAKNSSSNVQVYRQRFQASSHGAASRTKAST